jgi:biotin transporter BioY
MQSRNKHLMETIFEVSIQPTAGYLVNYYLSNHEVSKLYCNHMKQKFCHLLFTLASVRGALELCSGRNPDFS